MPHCDGGSAPPPLLALGARDDALPEPLQQWTIALAAMPPLEMATAPAAGEWSASAPLWTCPALLAPGARGGTSESSLTHRGFDHR